jgi:hypothetical protein
MGAIGYMPNSRTQEPDAGISAFADLQDNTRYTAEGVEPPCADTCGCIKLRTRHLQEDCERYIGQVLAAVRMICGLRGMPQSSECLNAVWGEVHASWLAGLDGGSRG